MDAQLENIVNFRDVGATVNAHLGTKVMREGQLYRSARPDGASLHDRQQLAERYGITHILDLRTDTEHIKQAQKSRPAATGGVISREMAAASLQFPGFQYEHVNVNGGAFERYLLWQLSWWNILKVLFLMLFGYRIQAIRILCTQVMEPRGLAGLAYDALATSGPELQRVFMLLSQPSTYPVLVHCTQGKDRTGIVVALVLLLLEIPLAAISDDYARSEAGLESDKAAMLEELHEMGLSAKFFRAAPEWIEKIDSHIKSKYGGITGYLEFIGVAGDLQDQIRQYLLVDEALNFVRV